MQKAVRILDRSSLPWLPISEPFSKPAYSSQESSSQEGFSLQCHIPLAIQDQEELANKGI